MNEKLSDGEWAAMQLIYAIVFVLLALIMGYNDKKAAADQEPLVVLEPVEAVR